MSRLPMELECPNCGERGYYDVLRTDKKYYTCGEERKPFFERIARRDISYRKHTRKCHNCKHQFTTIEMSAHYLTALMKEIGHIETNFHSWRKGSVIQMKQHTAQRQKMRDVLSRLSEKCQEQRSHLADLDAILSELLAAVDAGEKSDGCEV